MAMVEQLTDKDLDDLDALLGHLFDDHKAGIITKEQAVGAVAHLVTALDAGNLDEVETSLRQGRKFVRETGA